MKRSVIDQIRDLDAHRLVSAERLARYRDEGRDVSAVVQRGVIDRQLDARLELMRQRSAERVG